MNKVQQLAIPTMKQLPDILRLIEKGLNTLPRNGDPKIIDRNIGMIYLTRLTLIERCASIMPHMSGDEIRTIDGKLKELDRKLKEGSDMFILKDDMIGSLPALKGAVIMIQTLHAALSAEYGS